MIRQVGRGLALAFLAGPWSRPELLERAQQALDLEAAWLTALVDRLVAAFPAPPEDGEAVLGEFLGQDEQFRAAVCHPDIGVKIRRWLLPDPSMIPLEAAAGRFAILPIPTSGELPERLGLTVSELDWFADVRQMNARAEQDRLIHYRFRWVPKATGGYRLLEAPKSRIKAIQRQLLREVLAPIPVAPAAHGFVRGRGLLSFVAPHLRQLVVVRLDLQDFFASVSGARVTATFRRLGYPRPVALALAGLCTWTTPRHVLAAHPREGGDLGARFLENARLRAPHLPQGAPTSPTLANLAAWRLDRRLAALAAGFQASYTRYADDLAFSGDRPLERALPHLLPRAAAIAIEEGFAVNHRKTRIMRKGRRQHLGGLTVNDRPNVTRAVIDNLRALLHNAARFGPESQNRDAVPDFRRHLEGRIAWIASVNRARAARLTHLFQQIRWPAVAGSRIARPTGGALPFAGAHVGSGGNDMEDEKGPGFRRRPRPAPDRPPTSPGERQSEAEVKRAEEDGEAAARRVLNEEKDDD